MRRVFGQVLVSVVLAASGVAANSFPAAPVNDAQAAAQTGAASGLAADQRAAREADDAFRKALASHDRAALEKLLDEEFTWTDAQGSTKSRAQVLDSPPAPAISAIGAAPVTANHYAQVATIQSRNGRDNVLRVWVKRPAGWRQLLYQEVRLLDTEPVITPGTGATCENPCKTVPYQPKSEGERGAITAYMGLQTATVARDSVKWGTYVAEEFAAASSNSHKVLDKRTRMEDLERNKMAGYSPMPVVKMQVFEFADVVILVTEHQPVQGRPVHITRVWIERDGKWLEAASYQTRIQAASATP